MNPHDPAFPAGDGNNQGLTKREWFAGQALIGILSDPSVFTTPDGSFRLEQFTDEAKGHARLARIMADAMLEEMAKEEP